METKQRLEINRRRFTAEEYHKMGEAGIFGPDDRVELIEGEVVELNPIGARHAMCVIRLNQLLVSQIGTEALVSPQNPIKLAEGMEPQPDLAVIRARDYTGELPGPEDILLVVEVSDTTLRYDREIKKPLYARFGIPEVWIVDLTDEFVERHSDGRDADYRHTRRARRGEELASKILPSLVIPATTVLGPPS